VDALSERAYTTFPTPARGPLERTPKTQRKKDPNSARKDTHARCQLSCERNCDEECLWVFGGIKGFFDIDERQIEDWWKRVGKQRQARETIRLTEEASLRWSHQINR
jgi:hypothetical protein